MVRAIQTMTALGAVVWLAGCGGPDDAIEHPDTVPVTGKVTLDGKPVEGALITLQPQKEENSFAPRATSKADGTFELSTYFAAEDDVPGALPGKYKVAVVKNEAPKTMTHGDAVPTGPIGPSGGGGGGAHGGGGGGDHGVDGPANLLPANYANPESSGLEFEVKAGQDNVLTLELKSK